MKLSIRHFLAISIFLGAIAIPWGYRSYQERREAEIERVEKELAELSGELGQLLPFLDVDSPSLKALRAAQRAWYPEETLAEDLKIAFLRKRIAAIEARLEKLIGKKPKHRTSSTGYHLARRWRSEP